MLPESAGFTHPCLRFTHHHLSTTPTRKWQRGPYCLLADPILSISTETHNIAPSYLLTQQAQANDSDPMQPHRKGHYSCDFCRSRKLRCDRPLPCTNCVSRGKKCNFGQHQQHELSEAARPPPQAAPPIATNPEALLAELQAFRDLAQELEKRVLESTDPQLRDNDSNFSLLLSPGSNTGPASVNLGPAPIKDGHMREVVAHLERVSTCTSLPVSFPNSPSLAPFI